jgi:hypothetical protein
MTIIELLAGRAKRMMAERDGAVTKAADKNSASLNQNPATAEAARELLSIAGDLGGEPLTIKRLWPGRRRNPSAGGNGHKRRAGGLR